MPVLLTNHPVRLGVAIAAMSAIGLSAQAPAPGGQAGPTSMMQASPVLNAIDVNHDGTISAVELTDAPARIKTLDKNGDGKLTRDEAAVALAARGRGPGGPGGEGRGEGREGGRAGEAPEIPLPGPTADELLATLLTFDKNKDGKLTKAEVPVRQQGMFDRGDTDKNNVLDAAELKKMAADQAAAPVAPPPARRGGGPGRGGFGPFDPAANALDTDKNGEISAEEIGNATASLKTLDKNNDGSISEDEVRPVMGEGRGGAPTAKEDR